MQDSVLGYLERQHIHASRLTKSIDGLRFIRDDGYIYQIKAVHSRKASFTKAEYEELRGHSGEVFLFEGNKPLGIIPTWKLPIKGGEISIENNRVKINIGYHSTHTTIALSGEHLAILTDMCGSLERKLGRKFHNIGNFAFQAALDLAVKHNLLPHTRAEASSAWTFSAECPNCKRLELLRDMPRQTNLVYLVECPCGIRFLASRAI